MTDTAIVGDSSVPARARPPNVPADFVQTHLSSQHHPVFGDPSAHFVMDLGRFGGEDDEQALADLKLWEGADAEKEKLYQAIERYERKCQPKHRTCRTLDEIRHGAHTWNDILQEAGNASKKHEDKNIVIKYMRKLRDFASSFEGWADMLPQGDYSAALTIGFKIILTACARMSDIHGIVFEVMGSIPEYISNAERYKAIYKSTRNVKLVKKTALLYTAIVVALAQTFDYLGERSIVAPLKAFLLGQKYQKKLEEKLKAVLAATEAVKAEATLCLHEVNAQGLAEQQHNETQRRQDYAEALAETRQSDHKLYQKLESVDERLSYLTNALDAAYRQLRSSQYLDPVTNMPPQLQIQHSDASRSSSPMPSPTAVARRKAISTKQIVKSLGFHKEDPYNDLLDRLQLGGSMPLNQQARAVDLIKSEELKNWLRLTSSTALLIHGGSPDDDTEDPLSFFAAKIVSIMQESAPFITIQYFCGLHRDTKADDDPGGGGDAQAMMNSLLGQLLTQGKYDFDLVEITPQDLSMLETDDLRSLCMIFSMLVKQLPPASALFCVIDSIAAFENSFRSGDMVKVLRHLVRLVRKSNDVSFKLLITCAGESQFRKRYEISEREILLMDEELVHDDGLGYNDGLFDEDMTEPLEDDLRRVSTPRLQLEEYLDDF